MLKVQKWYVECISTENNRSILCVHLTLCCSSATSPNLRQVAYHLPQKQLFEEGPQTFSICFWQLGCGVKPSVRLLSLSFLGLLIWLKSSFKKELAVRYMELHGHSKSMLWDHTNGFLLHVCGWIVLRSMGDWDGHPVDHLLLRCRESTGKPWTVACVAPPPTPTHKTHPRKEMQKVRISAHPLTVMTRII